MLSKYVPATVVEHKIAHLLAVHCVPPLYRNVAQRLDEWFKKCPDASKDESDYYQTIINYFSSERDYDNQLAKLNRALTQWKQANAVGQSGEKAALQFYNDTKDIYRELEISRILQGDLPILPNVLEFANLIREWASKKKLYMELLQRSSVPMD